MFFSFFLKPSAIEGGEQEPQHTFHISPAFSPYSEVIHLHTTPALRSRLQYHATPSTKAGLLLPARSLPNEPFVLFNLHRAFYFGEKSVPAWRVPPSN